MTSNAGSDNNGTLLGFNKTVAEASKDKAMKALKDFLRPEFLGRVDDIIAFSALSTDSLENIAALILDELKPLLKERDIEFNYDTALCRYFAEKCDGRSGARDLRKMIRKEVEDRIIGLMIDNPDVDFKSMTAEAGDTVKISYQKI